MNRYQITLKPYLLYFFCLILVCVFLVGGEVNKHSCLPFTMVFNHKTTLKTKKTWIKKVRNVHAQIRRICTCILQAEDLVFVLKCQWLLDPSHGQNLNCLEHPISI